MHLYDKDAAMSNFLSNLEETRGPLNTFKQLVVFVKDWQTLQQELREALDGYDMKVECILVSFMCA